MFVEEVVTKGMYYLLIKKYENEKDWYFIVC